jgi:hypothetical protein
MLDRRMFRPLRPVGANLPVLLSWAAINALGGLVVSLLLALASQLSTWLALVPVTGAGAAFALPQWLFLRRYLPDAAIWIPTTCAASLISVPFALAAGLVVGGSVPLAPSGGQLGALLVGATVAAVAGVVIGGHQYWVFFRGVPGGIGWIAASGLGGAAFGAVVAPALLDPFALPGDARFLVHAALASAGLAYGALTAPSLVALVQRATAPLHTRL